MYGNPEAIHRLAGRVRERATDLRADADRMRAAAEQVTWQSAAADRMRAHVAERHAALRDSATDADEAAAALDHHADEVQRLQELIADIEARVMSMVSAAVDRVQHAASAIADGLVDLAHGRNPLDDFLTAFTPPPSGHKAWLDVPDQMPGG